MPIIDTVFKILQGYKPSFKDFLNDLLSFFVFKYNPIQTIITFIIFWTLALFVPVKKRVKVTIFLIVSTAYYILNTLF